jgi:aminomethyltransferase
MPVPTPFHPRTSALCTSLSWKEWAGCHAVRSYDTCHEREYMALRQSAGLIDVTPLYKYEVRGPDAAAYLARVTVRDIRKLKRGRVVYLCWCDDRGKLLDDGTVARLGDERFRVTAAEPCLAWLRQQTRGFRVEVADVTARVGALALQGPAAREILRQVSDAPLDKMKYFGIAAAELDGTRVEISRTGYTGDLGYEVWVDAEHALAVWDAIVDAGRAYRLAPAGLDALDVARVEAGFVMNGVDYFSANRCLIDARKSTPFETGLGWTVRLERDPFIGQQALREEKQRGSARKLVGLVIDWDELEELYDEHGLPPAVPAGAWRDPIPIYARDGHQVGQATSGAWSPILKRNLALATIEAARAEPGTRLRIEATVEYVRRRVGATVTETPFFDPERKRAL